MTLEFENGTIQERLIVREAGRLRPPRTTLLFSLQVATERRRAQASLYSVAVAARVRCRVRKADISMSDVWAKLEGACGQWRVSFGGAFWAARITASCSSRKRPKRGKSESRAETLVPAVPALAQLQLARWRASAALVHPHLIQIFEAGQCQIGAAAVSVRHRRLRRSRTWRNCSSAARSPKVRRARC